MSTKFIWLGVSGALLLGVPAIAQETQNGVRVGAFVVEPSVTVSGGYNDNYLSLTTDEVESYFVSIEPNLLFRSDWNRHAVQIQLGANYTEFEANENDSSFAFGGEVQGVLDITRAAQLILGAGYARQQEGRGQDDAINVAEEVTDIDNFSASIEGRYKPGQIRVSPFGSVGFTDFEDTDAIGGGINNNDDRDRLNFGYGIEVGYEFMRGYEAFVRAEGEGVRFRDDLDDAGFNRDSDGAKVLAGVNFAITRLIEGRVGVGYGFREFDDTRFASTEDIAIDVGVDWSVTPLTTVTLSGFQRFGETTSADSSGTSDRGGEVKITHSLLENVRVSAFGGYVNEEFDGIDRTDNTVTAGLGLAYDINRYFELGAGYEFEYQESDVRGDYTANEVTIGLTARY